MKNINKYFNWPVFCGVFSGIVLFEHLPLSSDSDSDLTGHAVNYDLLTVSYSHAIKKISPTVVNIFTARSTNSNPSSTHHTFSDLSQYKKSRIPENLGSGVIISRQGYIVTNYHVIRSADDITVMLQDGRQTVATVINYDNETDLAILKIDLPDLPTAVWADSARVEIGDIALAIGNPFGLGQTVSQGIISAAHRHLHLNTYESYLQTDAAIHSGNSGGPLINTRGEIIGIATAILSTDAGSEGLGFAIPANQVKFVSNSIIEHGRVIRGWLGIEFSAADPDVIESSSDKILGGLLISDIYPGSPAHNAGLKPGDLITSINSAAVYSPMIAANFIAARRPGSSIQLKIERNSRSLSKNIRVDERPDTSELLQGMGHK